MGDGWGTRHGRSYVTDLSRRVALGLAQVGSCLSDCGDTGGPASRSANSLEHPVGKPLARLHPTDGPFTQEHNGDGRLVKIDLAIFWHRRFCRECNGALGGLNEPGLELMKRLTNREGLTLMARDQRVLAGWVLRTSLSMDFAVHENLTRKIHDARWQPDPARYLARDDLPPNTVVRIGGYKAPQSEEADPFAITEAAEYPPTLLRLAYVRHIVLWYFVGQLMVGEDAITSNNYPEDCGHLVRIWPPKHDLVSWPRPCHYDESGVNMLGSRLLLT